MTPFCFCQPCQPYLLNGNREEILGETCSQPRLAPKYVRNGTHKMTCGA
jgi:hypothetical protein